MPMGYVPTGLTRRYLANSWPQAHKWSTSSSHPVPCKPCFPEVCPEREVWRQGRKTCSLWTWQRPGGLQGCQGIRKALRQISAKGPHFCSTPTPSAIAGLCPCSSKGVHLTVQGTSATSPSLTSTLVTPSPRKAESQIIPDVPTGVQGNGSVRERLRRDRGAKT